MASLSPSPARFHHLQMASLSPFPQLYFDECKFTGTLVSNPLLPSSRERQTCQSNSSGSRRLNRGNCCTPKFSLQYSSRFIKNHLQNSPRVAQCKGLLNSQNQGFDYDKENEGSKGPIKSHMPTNMVKHPHTKFQDLQHKIAQSKTLIAQQSTAGAKWLFDSQKFKFLVNISF